MDKLIQIPLLYLNITSGGGRCKSYCSSAKLTKLFLSLLTSISEIPDYLS